MAASASWCWPPIVGVRIGIEAPPSPQIQREELVLRVAGENRRAGDAADLGPWAALLTPPVTTSPPD